jgi:hypothetical protein
VERRDVKFEEDRAFRKSYQGEDVLETEASQHEEASSPQTTVFPTDGQNEEQVEDKSGSFKKRKPKWEEQLLK